MRKSPLITSIQVHQVRMEWMVKTVNQVRMDIQDQKENQEKMARMVRNSSPTVEMVLVE